MIAFNGLSGTSFSMPTHDDPWLVFIRNLNALGLPYVTTGSIASSIYGEPRLTHDIDLVLELDADSVERFCRAFPIEEFYCPPIDAIQNERNRSRRGHIKLIHHETGYKADVYFVGDDPLHRWALQHRRTVQVGAVPVSVAPPEYVIIRKLEYCKESGSEKRIRDILGILALTASIDHSWIQSTAEGMGLSHLWMTTKTRAAGDRE